MPRAFTRILFEDELLLCGHPSSLANVTAVVKGQVMLMSDSAAEKLRRKSTRFRARDDDKKKNATPPEETTIVQSINAFEDEGYDPMEGFSHRRKANAVGPAP